VAAAAGFADVGFCSARPFEDWRRANDATQADSPDAATTRAADTAAGTAGAASGTANGTATSTALTHDPHDLMAQARGIIVAVRPYGTFEPWPDGTAAIANYYVHSAAGHNAVRQIAAWLREQGFAALANPGLPAKQAAIRAGLGFQGLNTQFCHNNLGLTVSLQLVLTDAPLPYMDVAYQPCDVCGLCTAACPTGAISTAGFDRERCLRQHMLAGTAMPVHLREKMGRRLIGCTDCQDACPHAQPVPEPIPADLLAACAISNLLRRDKRSIETIARHVGRNYGRPLRLCRQAAIAAGNSGDRQYISALVALLGDPDSILRRHAAWALGQLGGEDAKAAIGLALTCESAEPVRAELAAALAQMQ
jgi:epoxyqueuosine reductase